MNAMNALRRHPSEIHRDIRSHREVFLHLRDIAAEFAACDMRPFVIVDGHLTYTRELNIPPNLITLMREEAEVVQTLEAELHHRPSR